MPVLIAVGHRPWKTQDILGTTLKRHKWSNKHFFIDGLKVVVVITSGWPQVVQVKYDG